MGYNINKWDGEQKDLFISKCLSSFGSMNKTDYETALFWLLLKNEFMNKSDFEISLLLKIPESKVRTLRYQVHLKFLETDEKEILNELKQILIQCKYRVQGDKIQFAITDKLYWSYLFNLLNKNGRFADTSYNKDIISLSAKDLLYILVIIFPESKEDIDSIKDEVEKEGVSLEKTLMQGMRDILVAVGKDAVGKLLPKNTADATTDFIKLLKDKIKTLLEKRKNE